MIKCIEREIELLEKIHNDNIIELHDWVMTRENNEKVYYLIYELADEGDLEKKLKASKYLPENEVINYMIQIGNGFKALEKIIHRDIKPSNIVFKNGVAKIIDFDFAKFVDLQPTNAIGTYRYKSPEVFKGEIDLTKCDIWSFGMMLFELLYGRFPWIPKTECDHQFLEVQAKYNSIDFPKMPEISAKMQKLLTGMIVYKVEDRMDWKTVFKNIDEFDEIRYKESPNKMQSKVLKINDYYCYLKLFIFNSYDPLLIFLHSIYQIVIYPKC